MMPKDHSYGELRMSLEIFILTSVFVVQGSDKSRIGFISHPSFDATLSYH
jgi:hypothetical protein